MVNTELIAGVNSYLLYGAESTYGTAATVNKVFGLVKSFNPSHKNNYIKCRGFTGSTSGGRDLAFAVAGKYEAGFSVEFQPQVWEWLLYVLGAQAGSGTTGAPYVYTGANKPTSLTIAHELDNVTTDREEAFLGCIINTCTIKASVGEPVMVTLDVLCADLDVDATLTANTTLSSLSPFTFAGGTIEIPNGTLLDNIIDSVEITISNNAEIIYGLGSRIGKQPNFKARDYTVKFTVKYLDETLIDYFMGSATGPVQTYNPTAQATVAVRFQNASNHYADFVFTTGYLDGFDENSTLNDMITEDYTYVCKTLTVSEAQS